VTDWGWPLLIGLVLGAGIAALAARWQIRRSLAKARAAERRARSAERLAEVGAMTGGLAHEIKNPLSTIGLNAQLLAEGVDELPTDHPIDPEAKQRLSRRLSSLRREVERLRGILTDFLTFAGEIKLDLAETDLNKVVDELADFFLPQAQQQGVRMRVELSPTPLQGAIDAPLIKQAVLNLMLNAVQAMSVSAGGSGGGSEPQPSQNHAAPRELILRTTRETDPEGHSLNTLHVIDTGPGIPPDVMGRIFTPYFTTKSGGTGLGLPTTRRIVEAHQGRIDIQTEPGRGTDFVVRLPAQTAVPVSQ
jgi:signal transduction histidine kinase